MSSAKVSPIKVTIRFPVLLILLTLAMTKVMGQSDSRSFPSLELPVAAELSALGGLNVSRSDYMVSMFQSNPALSSDTLNGWTSFNHLFYLAGTGFSTFAYQHDFGHFGSVSFGLNHLRLGSIEGYDPSGLPTGQFNAGETTVIIGKSHQMGVFRLGVNLKGTFSNLAGYRASAVLTDIGGSFIHPEKDLSLGLVIKNLGMVLNEFSPTSTSALPFDVQLGASFKPEHMPLRFSGAAYRLSDYRIPYDNQNDDEASTLDKVASHLTFGAELLIHKNVNLLLGYNFLRHKELKLESAAGGSGFSIGASARVKNLSVSLSRSGYVTSGAYHISINIDSKKIITAL